MPGGSLMIEPVPVPILVMLTPSNAGGPTPWPFMNVAVAVRSAKLSTTVQTFPATLSQPLQPPKLEAVAGVAVNVTSDSLGKSAAHGVAAGPQLIPRGLLVTVPVPVPLVATVTVRSLRKVAATVLGDVERRRLQLRPIA
jgi:hypothetical protein